MRDSIDYHLLYERGSDYRNFYVIVSSKASSAHCIKPSPSSIFQSIKEPSNLLSHPDIFSPSHTKLTVESTTSEADLSIIQTQLLIVLNLSFSPFLPLYHCVSSNFRSINNNEKWMSSSDGYFLSFPSTTIQCLDLLSRPFSFHEFKSKRMMKKKKERRR